MTDDIYNQRNTIKGEQIKKIFRDLGIEYSGICDVDYGKEAEKYLEKRKKLNLLSGMEEEDIKKRINAKSVMENAESVIVAAFPYFAGDIKDSNLSCYCRGYDYHIVAREIMKKACERITELLTENEKKTAEFNVYADNGPLIDRYLAYMSGIGFFGLNGSIITEKYGSYVFIGYIVTSLNIEKDIPADRTCMKCGKCIKRCPGGALKENYLMDAKKCLSYLTQKKGELSDEEKHLIKSGGLVFGCDVCQKVCPHNKNAEQTCIEEFKTDILDKLDIDEINEISNREFKRRYGNRAFSWRGKGIIKRNLEIIEE